jgi:hypothetical protein
MAEIGDGLLATPAGQAYQTTRFQQDCPGGMGPCDGGGKRDCVNDCKGLVALSAFE